MELKEFGYHQFDSFLKMHEITILPESYLGQLMFNNSGKGVLGNQYSNLLNLSVAVESLVERNLHVPWLVSNLEELASSPYKTMTQKIHLNSKVAAEVIAGGLLADVFNEIEPLPEVKGEKTPDYKLLGSTYVEVYCPQTSQQNITAVRKQQEAQKDKLVSIAFSHPLTGQASDAKSYPANKVIDRVINQKRENDQTKNESTNLLWLDLTHGFDVDCNDTQPLKTVLHVGTVYTGSFGIWHAFYGKVKESTFASERTELRYLDFNCGFYQQMAEGLFRQRSRLHGAILLAKDGLLFFENPWSQSSLGTRIKLTVILSK